VLLGLAGEGGQVLAPHTEADLVAWLTACLVALGNGHGRRPPCTAEAAYQALKPHAVLGGHSATGRKRSACGHVYHVGERVDEV
jgi:hypothetical protein